MTEAVALVAGTLILAWPLDVIDDEGVDGGARWFELEPELLRERGEQIRTTRAVTICASEPPKRVWAYCRNFMISADILRAPPRLRSSVEAVSAASSVPSRTAQLIRPTAE